MLRLEHILIWQKLQSDLADLKNIPITAYYAVYAMDVKTRILPIHCSQLDVMEGI